MAIRIPDTKLAAMSWEAKPRARPKIPTPARSEVTASSNWRTDRAVNTPIVTTATYTSVWRRRETWGLWMTRFRTFRITPRMIFAINTNRIITRMATTMLGSMPIPVSIHPVTFAQTFAVASATSRVAS